MTTATTTPAPRVLAVRAAELYKEKGFVLSSLADEAFGLFLGYFPLVRWVDRPLLDGDRRESRSSVASRWTYEEIHQSYPELSPEDDAPIDLGCKIGTALIRSAHDQLTGTSHVGRAAKAALLAMATLTDSPRSLFDKAVCAYIQASTEVDQGDFFDRDGTVLEKRGQAAERRARLALESVINEGSDPDRVQVTLRCAFGKARATLGSYYKETEADSA